MLKICGSGIKMGLIFGKIWYKNGSTFQVSAARPYPNHTWVAPSGLHTQCIMGYVQIIYFLSSHLFLFKTATPLPKVARKYNLVVCLCKELGSTFFFCMLAIQNLLVIIQQKCLFPGSYWSFHISLFID